MLLRSQPLALFQLPCVGVFLMDGKEREGKNGFDYNQERETSVSSSGKEDDNQEEKGSLSG